MKKSTDRNTAIKIVLVILLSLITVTVIVLNVISTFCYSLFKGGIQNEIKNMPYVSEDYIIEGRPANPNETLPIH